MPLRLGYLLATATVAVSPSLAGAVLPGPASISIEAVTDERRRGISWSDGKASASASIRAPLFGGVEADARLSALRGSSRFEGAEAGLTTGLRHVTRAGPWTLEAGVVGNLFINRARLNHVELQAAAAHQLGPVQARLLAAYAPSQDAIGGDNLYLSGSLDTAIPGTPYTIYGGVGRSSGDIDDPLRANMLRPGGNYWDHRIGIERVAGPLVIGLRYSDTDIAPSEAAHSGARLVGYLSVGL